MKPHFNIKNCVAKGTGYHAFIGWSMLVIGGPLLMALTAIGTMGLALAAWVVLAISYFGRVKRAKAKLRGSALRVSADQFPEIHSAAVTIAESMGVAEPEIFIVEGNQQNAFALKHGSKGYVILVDDIVFGALATGNVGALHFILAHELAHHALGHTGVLRSIVSMNYKPLSRLDEFSCDAVAHAIVNDSNAALDALTLLLIGPQIFARVNKAALERQAREVAGNSHSKKSEKGMTHPLLLRRYSRITEIIRAPSAAVASAATKATFDLIPEMPRA
jgi:Zn-dependent protease with chaperone function